MTPAATAPSRPGIWRTVLGVALDPGALISSRLAHTHVALALSVSGLAFTLFFLQTGLDRARDGQIDGAAVAFLALAGLIYGTLGVAVISLAGWLGARLLGGTAAVGDAIRAFALAYSPTLIYVAFGLVFNLTLGWNTTVAFGVTGLLWALGPMISALKGMVGGRTWPATLLATGCGLLVLLGWARIGALV